MRVPTFQGWELCQILAITCVMVEFWRFNLWMKERMFALWWVSLRFSSPTLRRLSTWIPNTKCEGNFINVPIAKVPWYVWTFEVPLCQLVCMVRFHMCSLVVNIDYLWEAMFWVSWCVLSWWLLVALGHFSPIKNKLSNFRKTIMPSCMLLCFRSVLCFSGVWMCLAQSFFPFFFQFCDEARMATIDKSKEPNLATGQRAQ
jgi:hypothetical protein